LSYCLTYAYLIKFYPTNVNIVVNRLNYGRLQWQRLTHDRPDLSSERPPQKDKTVTLKKKSLVKSPRFGLDTKTYWLTDCQSQCDFDFVVSSGPAGFGGGGGALKNWDSKIWLKYHRTQTWERLCWWGPAINENYIPDLLSERAPDINKPVTVQKKKKKKR
jgi:hypothetical protein